MSDFSGVSLPSGGIGPGGPAWAMFLAALQDLVRATNAQTQAVKGVTNSATPVVALLAAVAPGTPPAGQFYIYMDSADNTLKAKGPSGTVTPLAVP